MDFSDQQDLLDELLGESNESTDDMWDTATRKAAINRGEVHFAVDAKCCKEYATGVVADNKIAFPTDCVEIFCLVIDDEVIDSWREIDLHQWERFEADNSEEPYYYVWTYSGTKYMKFFDSSGVNGKTYELYYYRKPTTALNGDNDASIIPDEFREGSVYWAAARLLMKVGMMKLSRQMMSQYDEAENLVGGYNFFVAKAKEQAEKEHIKENRPTPDIGNLNTHGGYHQGDGGHSGV